MTSPVIFLSKIPAIHQNTYLSKLLDVCKRLHIEPNWLQWVIYKETAGTFNPAIQNAKTNATGLIQFMPRTAAGLGTSVTALKAMNVVQQLDWVYKYYAPKAGKIKSVHDLYAVTFWPIAIGKADTYVFETKTLTAERVASMNRVVDINKDGKITFAEFKKYVEVGMTDTIKASVLKVQQATAQAIDKATTFVKANPATAIMLIALILFAAND